jgi:hypothetical protein
MKMIVNKEQLSVFIRFDANDMSGYPTLRLALNAVSVCNNYYNDRLLLHQPLLKASIIIS